MNEVMEEGKARIDWMDVVVRYSHLDTSMKAYTPMCVIVPTLKYEGEVRKGNAKLVEKLGTVQNDMYFWHQLRKYSNAQK